MKISLVVSDFSGGGAIRAFLLARVLLKLGYQVEVVGFQFGKDLYAIPPQDIPIHPISGTKYPQILALVPQLLHKMDGDILYAIKPKPTSFGLALLDKLKTRRPVLLDMDDWEMSWHGGDDWCYRPSPKQLYRDMFKPNGQLREPDHPLYVKWMEGWVRRADAITVDTAFLQRRFGGVYLANGKDTDLFDPQHYDPEICRSRYGLSDYRVLMFPGAPRPHKGVEDVLIALDLLNEPDLRLAIVGGSPYDNYDEQLRERWGRWIVKLPRRPVEAMPEMVAAAHAIVVPQRNTPAAIAQFPLKLTDGMAMAKPILSTRVGDIPEILGDTGFLVDPNAPEQIAEKIQWIFAHLDVAQARAWQARQRCVKYYSIDAMADSLSQPLSRFT